MSYQLSFTPLKHPNLEGSPFWVECKEGIYCCQVTVIDLVSKDDTKIDHHFKAMLELTDLITKKMSQQEDYPLCCDVPETYS